MRTDISPKGAGRVGAFLVQADGRIVEVAREGGCFAAPTSPTLSLFGPVSADTAQVSHDLFSTNLVVYSFWAVCSSRVVFSCLLNKIFLLNVNVGRLHTDGAYPTRE